MVVVSELFANVVSNGVVPCVGAVLGATGKVCEVAAAVVVAASE